MEEDLSNGYEAVVAQYLKRSHFVGLAEVRNWARVLPPGATVLDVGCGNGIPLGRILLEEGLAVYGVDASPGMVAAYRENCPSAQVVCEAVEHSSFFGRKFDAALSWGLFFLLPAEKQLALIKKVAAALNPQGRFLFTAPWQIGSWNDNLTGRLSWSLGEKVYKTALLEAGFQLLGEYDDEGRNHYYDAVKG